MMEIILFNLVKSFYFCSVYVVCHDNSHQQLKYRLVFVLYVNLCQMSQICSKIANFLFSACFWQPFCYHIDGKSQINTRCLQLGTYEENGEK